MDISLRPLFAALPPTTRHVWGRMSSCGGVPNPLLPPRYRFRRHKNANNPPPTINSGVTSAAGAGSPVSPA